MDEFPLSYFQFTLLCTFYECRYGACTKSLDLVLKLKTTRSLVDSLRPVHSEVFRVEHVDLYGWKVFFVHSIVYSFVKMLTLHVG